MGCGPSKPWGFDAALTAFDPNLRVVWSHGYNVWEIQERGRFSGQWHYVMYWAHVEGRRAPTYMALPDTIEPIRKKLYEIDMTRLGNTPRAQWRELCAKMDGTREHWLKAKMDKIDTAGREYMEDMAARGGGIRQTFGPGGPRSRAGMAAGSQNMRDFMRSATKGTA